VIPQPPGPKSRATAATIDYRLQQILPAGRTSGFAHATDDPVFAQINLDQGHGPSMMRMSLTPGGSPGSNWCKPKKADGLTDDCVTLPNGTIASITRNPGNCIEAMTVDVDHGNGTNVMLMVATCGAWNGKENPPCAPALTEAQAIKVAADPSWGLAMDSALVAAAQRKFPHLGTFF
jgi:hypothetical protein